jgi:hypothetical protein
MTAAMTNSSQVTVAELHVAAQRLRDEANGIEPTIEDVIEAIAYERAERDPDA